MPLTLIATPGAANANSYVSLADAVAYFEGRVAATAWEAATAPQREQALVAATSRLEQERYVGTLAGQAQRLKWPRADVRDDDGRLYATDAVPRPIVEACCELALHFLSSGSDPLAPTGLESLSQVKVGELTIDLNPSADPAGALPPQVLRLLRDLRETLNTGVRLVRA